MGRKIKKGAKMSTLSIRKSTLRRVIRNEAYPNEKRDLIVNRALNALEAAKK